MGFTHKLVNFVLLLQCILSISCTSYNTNIFRAKTEYDDIVKCVENVARKYFPCGTLVTLVEQNKSIDQLIQAITNDHCYTLIIKSLHGGTWLVWTEVYIIISENVAEFLSIIQYLRKDVLWNPKGIFLIIVQHMVSEEVSDVMKICSRYKMYNVLLLIPYDGDKTIMFTYNPFKEKRCGDNIDPVNLGTCGEIDNTTNIFSDKRPNDLRNCIFRVVAGEDIPNFIFESSNFKVYGESVMGVEQYILETIQAREGIKISYILKHENQYGVILPNGTATNLLRYLEKDRADIAGGGFILIKNRMMLFDFISGTNYGSFSVFTPNVGEPIWKDVYRAFGFTTWILIICTFCLVATICYKIRHTVTINLRERNTFLSLWGYLCGNASAKLPKEKRIKTILIYWLWFTFFITNFYNTALYSLVTRRVRIKRHMNPENLAELPYRPCITEATRVYFLFAYNKHLPEGENYLECQYTDTALKFIATRSDLYGIEMDYTYILQEFKYVNEEGIPKLESSQFSNNIVMGFYVARGFVFKDKMQDYVYRMQENGLLSRQFNIILQQGKSKALRRLQRFRQIRMPDLVLHYCLLLLGYSISFICLILEIYTRRQDSISNNLRNTSI